MKNAHSVSSNRRSSTAEYQCTELEPRVNVGEERRQICPKPSILEIEQPDTRPLVETDLKNRAAVLSA